MEEAQIQKFHVHPGIYTMASENNRLVLAPTSFTSQALLEDYVNTKEITDKVETFFSKLDIYKKFNLDPKRAMLLYGPPGTGKSLIISKVATAYAATKDTLVVVWPTDKFEARQVKDFIKSFEYTKNAVSKLILVIEDLGGVEQDNSRRYSEASLLSLLDNVEHTFSVPTMIIATTNFPENFLENLTNRPQRFDDVIEVKRPEGAARSRFLEFFSLNEASEQAKAKIALKKYDVFSVAHVKEVIIRSALYDISLEAAMDQLLIQTEKAATSFTKKRQGMGIGSFDFGDD
jgi:cell division protease FtsH